ncbi:MAG: cyclopropane-fatty-acyl-phospholipid synthase [Candidatus Liptonbacteria bacterium RIFCSPLOWO2_01_FULL_56_20]|uniref:Cyclopropane-fatty-acyl-phospholipid synthase n=1 Tax=Candidatus Liptonbacteria bacterium RIFCSPLOWO2_01_FULL_56_20 TaxID=1798652 RepID=A0A1G2CKW6_9BACT|nr:MAG: cyclopropane-fatty-acyl-phospholipid synthase [Candidatus Liptonbacteria bacterium RIFCSPLOWO2_01_FULL_56_20]
MTGAKTQIVELLTEAGVKINGSNTWDIQVFDERLYSRVLAGGSLALGEAYMDGWWDSPALDQFLHKIFSARLEKKFRLTWASVMLFIKSFFFNLQGPRRVFQIGDHHYDIGNDLYQAMLDKRLTYTCGYWNGNPPARGLDEAQEAKLDLVCRKIGLKKREAVLDIGCGWGSFAKYAAEKYGASVTGITVSKEQVALGTELCRNLPVEIKLQDYRDVRGEFDHVVSLGMFEHVGVKNYRTYIKAVADCLKDSGLFLLHAIGSNRSVYSTDPWVQKYIFPNGMLPSAAQIARAIEGLFVMEDWHNFGADYDKTLMMWFRNFNRAWPDLKGKYGERFYRMWKFYLLSCAAAFRARRIQLWQIVLSKRGIPGGYMSIR